MKWFSIVWINALLLLCRLQDLANCLRLTEVRIPTHVLRNSGTQLECHYDLDGDALYSVKWYKDGNEFYRYVPRDMPPVTTFNRTGITVDLHNSTDTMVVLTDAEFATGGIYRCEVSAEAPSFQTVSDHGEITVVALPEEGPRITGGRPRYALGEPVQVNCTSGFSRPKTHLSWFINGDPANPGLVHEFDSIVRDEDGLEATLLGLQFRARPRHFRKGDLKLKCLATIASIYWRSNEESAAYDKPLKQPVLLTWENDIASDHRSKRVQSHQNNNVDGINSAPIRMQWSLATIVISLQIMRLIIR